MLQYLQVLPCLMRTKMLILIYTTKKKKLFHKVHSKVGMNEGLGDKTS